MTYKNQNAAYDLSLFDDGYSAYNEGSAAPKHTEQESTGKKSKRKQRKANNVVKLPEEEYLKSCQSAFLLQPSSGEYVNLFCNTDINTSLIRGGAFIYMS